MSKNRGPSKDGAGDDINGDEPSTTVTARDDPNAFHSVFGQVKVVSTEEILKRKQHISQSITLTIVVALAIVLNAFLIGVEVDYVQGDSLEDRFFFFIAEIIFLTIFLFEMFAKLHLDGWNYFLDPWNIMDYHLVVMGFVDMVVTLLFSGSGDMRVITTFRMLRMLRIVRQIRLLRMFRDLWTIVKGFYDSLVTVFWVAVLLFIICYAVGILLVISIGTNDFYAKYWINVDVYVGSVGRAMLTVFQVITLESWSGQIVRPLAEKDPFIVIIFLVVIILCSFGLLNVIIGVIVERTLVVAQENEQTVQKIIGECEKRVMISMRQEFLEFAADTSDNELNFDQFCQAIRTKSFQNKLRIIGLPLEDAEELFFLLDVDNSQTLSVDEFINGVQKMKGVAQGADMIQLLAFVQRASRRALALQGQADKLISQADSLLERLDDMWGITEAELHEREFSVKRQRELAEKVRKREELLERLEKNRQHRDASMNTDPKSARQKT